MRNETLKISLFIAGPGHHLASWRYPSSVADGSMNLEYLKETTLTAEKGKFDFVFFADGLYIDENSHPNILAGLEPLTLLAALSQNTKNIGLAATASTTYNEPYNLARKFASLDHISKGRIGWNMVTTVDPNSASNFFGEKHMEHEKRYDRADEFVEISKKLWDSWEDDALVRNKKTGKFFEENKLHKINHEGDFFTVSGPLNIARSPQGYPVLIQAGTSETGQNFAAKHAEVIFANHVNIDDAKSFYKNIKSKARNYGRLDDSILIMPGISPVIGDTEKEAQEKYDLLQELIHPSFGIMALSRYLGGVNFSQYSLDESFPQFITTGKVFEGRKQELIDFSNYNNFNLGQLAKYVAGRNGHNFFVGTPEKLADKMQKWFEERAADAFNLMPLVIKEDTKMFVEKVIPILQKRGIFREEYTGSTLRENLGLLKPKNKFADSKITQ